MRDHITLMIVTILILIGISRAETLTENEINGAFSGSDIVTIIDNYLDTIGELEAMRDELGAGFFKDSTNTAKSLMVLDVELEIYYQAIEAAVDYLDEFNETTK